MTDDSKSLAKQVEETQKEILAEEKVVRVEGEGHSVQVTVGAGGEVVVRISREAEEPTSDVEDLLAPEKLPCQEPLAGPCADPFPTGINLATLQFTRAQEEAIQRVIRLTEGSRDRVLERLWERAVARLIADEAKRVLREAKVE